MGRRIDVTMDCADAPILAAFWKLALGYVDEPPPAPFASRGEWLASFDVPEDEWDTGAWLCDPDGIGPRLSILPVPEGKVAKNRVHMDIRVPRAGSDEETWDRVIALVEELVDAGGRVLHRNPGGIVMADPEGNEFCVAMPSSGDRRPEGRAVGG